MQELQQKMKKKKNEYQSVFVFLLSQWFISLSLSKAVDSVHTVSLFLMTTNEGSNK